MGGGAFEPKSLVGQGIEANCTKKKKAFTLAEVLITLAIIGVVAALTIPVIVAKYQQKMLYTNFMKTFNTLSNAMSIATAEHGGIDTWGFSDDNMDEIIEKNILPYLKVTHKITESDTEYEYPASTLNGETSHVSYYGGYEEENKRVEYYRVDWTDSLPAYVLSDGSIVSFGYWNDKICADFDTTGIKGPNVVGRDLFSEGFCYAKMTDGKYVSIPNYMLGNYENNAYTLKSREQLEEEFFGDDPEYSCTPEKPGGTFNCASRLILEGKMDY